MKLTRPFVAAALAVGMLSACASDPSPSDRSEEGVEAALTEYVEVGLQGDRTADQQERYCNEIITAEAREAAFRSCAEPITYESNSTWKEIAAIEAISIDGDMAVVEWRWRGKDYEQTHPTDDTFIYEDGRWRAARTL